MLLVVNAAAAAVLLNAGIGKLVAPQYAHLALAEVLPALRFTAGTTRAIAALELCVASSLLFVPTRSAFAVVVLGLGFAVLGVLGLLRNSTTPCGCLGSSSRRPLGRSNIVFGLALTIVGWFNLYVAAAPQASYAASTIALTAIGSVLLSLWTHRRLLIQFGVR